jgi:DNA modification methylase
MKTAPSTTPTYRPVLRLPPLPDDQYEGLRNNIALNGVLVPILTDGGSPVRLVIDGNQRKRLADEFGYPCPEVVRPDLDPEEMRALARALNLARRALTSEQKRTLIADQLTETPGRTNRMIAKLLGVDHKTVASVRAEAERLGEIPQHAARTGRDGRTFQATKNPQTITLSEAERRARRRATTLVPGDCRQGLKTIGTASVDCVVTDPPYPGVQREYGKLSEPDWQDLMRAVVRECRRALKPTGSMVVILQPTFRKAGRMRLWPWEFVLWAAGQWNLVQDVYWARPDPPPGGVAAGRTGLLRSAVKWCVWLGPPTCYRNQAAVLKPPCEHVYDRRREQVEDWSNGYTCRRQTMNNTTLLRGGATPFNVLTISAAHGSPASVDHPAVLPLAVADWWVRYLLPAGGVLLDPFAGTGTTLEAGLAHGASRVIGIEKMAKYRKQCERRLFG